MNRWRIAVYAGIVLLCGVMEAYAIGRVYARLPNNPSSPIYNLRIKTLAADVVIKDQLAVTHVDQEFANDNGFRLEGFYAFTLPEGAQVHELYLWINGIRTPYTIKKREEAVEQYTEIVQRTMDPAILEQLGPNRFQLRIWPFNAYGTRRIEIQYSQPLTYFLGTIQYVFPLDMSDYTSAPIETASLSVELGSQLPILSVETSADPTPAAVQITKIDARHYTIQYGLENVAFSRDFKIRCAIDRAGKPLLALTYAPPSPAEAPSFLLWSALPDSLASDTVRSREITFVADVSSSMEGNRLQQTKDALAALIGLLNEDDRFNIISFSTATASFRPDLVQATAAAKDSARTFVSRLTALGLTNFEAALQKGLLQSNTLAPPHATLIFLTDGQPTWGVTDPDSILARVRTWNTRDIGIFPIAVGDLTDYSLLRNLAAQNRGACTEIAADDSIYFKVKDLFRLLFLPRVTQIAVDYGTIGAFDVFPDTIAETYAGDQFLTAGRFDHPGFSHVTVSGMVGAAAVAVAGDLGFAAQDTSTLAIARYWASLKIRHLLSMIAQVGEQPELVDQVIALSIKYSVISPYTAFLIVEPTNNGATAVDDGAQHPSRFALHQNYPNPFNPSTVVSFELPVAARVKLVIYDLLGRIVAVLVDGEQEPGVHRVTWDATGLASGVYICRMEAGGFVGMRKFMVMK